MSSRARKNKRRMMKVRFWLMGILLIFALGIFCFAIVHGTQYGFTSITIFCGLAVVGLQLGAGSIGGPALKEWIEKRKQAKLIKKKPHS